MKNLTTKERVKSLLGLTSTTHDTVIDQLVASVSGFIYGYTNRNFDEVDYVEVVDGSGIHELYLRNYPVIALTSTKYRSGNVASPDWTDFQANTVSLTDSEMGELYFDGLCPKNKKNIQITYTAGYLIDFDHPTDITKHNLPADLSGVADNLVVRAFNKRKSTGITQESLEGAVIMWQGTMDLYDKNILDRYSKIVY
jgi:hypothetical protein